MGSYYTPPRGGGSTSGILHQVTATMQSSDIQNLDTVPFPIIPAVPGKTIIVVTETINYNFGTKPFCPLPGTTDDLKYQSGALIAFASGNLASALEIGGAPSSVSGQIYTVGTSSQTAYPFAQMRGQGVEMYASTPGFNTGSPSIANPTSGHAGLLYAPGDTGTIAKPANGIIGNYTVLTVGAGGAVLTIAVTEGNGYQAGDTGIGTTVLTGSGDGNLQLDISAITPQGDGTADVMVTYLLQ